LKLSFHGADLGVTGSCHLLEANGKRILIDCGMMQGSRELDEDNAQPFGFDPAAIDAVLLTHAHLDHCGRLPLLYKQGFRGTILATDATRELARLVMLDSAHLQEEDGRRRSRHDSRAGGEVSAPLYSVLDAMNCLDRFGPPAAYGTPIDLAPGLVATFFDAGHILGSASILISCRENGRDRSIVFSGDLGNAGRPLLRPPSPPKAADFVVMESTYGDRLHRPFAESVEEFYRAVSDAFARGGNVVVPTFALERAQEILFFLRQGIEQNRLTPSAQVFLDSPMAISATEIFRHHPECLEPDVGALFSHGKDPFALPGLHMTRETMDSIAINRIGGAPSSWRDPAWRRAAESATICGTICGARNRASSLSAMPRRGRWRGKSSTGRNKSGCSARRFRCVRVSTLSTASRPTPISANWLPGASRLPVPAPLSSSMASRGR
jgi:metallo-beta-lactamase family protein